MEKDEVVRLAKKNLVEGERWHKKVNVREIVFGFNDGSISTLALLAGVTGGALAHGRILVAGFSGVIAGAISMAIGAYISSKSEIEHSARLATIRSGNGFCRNSCCSHTLFSWGYSVIRNTLSDSGG